jgi:ABC-type multidrug transport system ATPase subunit
VTFYEDDMASFLLRSVSPPRVSVAYVDLRAVVAVSVVLLLDEPTWDLDPLNTYFIVSILSNHAKKYNRILILTMEKPRSDIFPFLDRVTYLCLGDVVYTGATRMMLDYFRCVASARSWCPAIRARTILNIVY